VLKDLNVKSLVREYIGREAPDRIVLRSTLDTIAGELPNTVIFGGMLREFALGSARTFVSDIDLVTASSTDDIKTALNRFSPTRNRFGGFRFCSGKWRFDLWSLMDTWAIREGFVRGSDLTDLLSTTFFNLDSIVLHITNKRQTFSPEFARGVSDRFLEINLAANPDPERMVQRAIRMAVEHTLAVGPQLCKFIMTHASCARETDSPFLRDMDRHLSTSTNPYTFRPQQNMPLDEKYA
jgi:hypothetical protein